MANWGRMLASGLGMALETENTEYAEKLKENRVVAKARYAKQNAADEADFAEQTAYHGRVKQHLGPMDKATGKYPNKNDAAVSREILTRQALKSGVTTNLHDTVTDMMKEQEGQEFDLGFLDAAPRKKVYDAEGWKKHMATTKAGPLASALSSGVRSGVDSLFGSDSKEPDAVVATNNETQLVDETAGVSPDYGSVKPKVVDDEVDLGKSTTRYTPEGKPVATYDDPILGRVMFNEAGKVVKASPNLTDAAPELKTTVTVFDADNPESTPFEAEKQGHLRWKVDRDEDGKVISKVALSHNFVETSGNHNSMDVGQRAAYAATVKGVGAFNGQVRGMSRAIGKIYKLSSGDVNINASGMIGITRGLMSAAAEIDALSVGLIKRSLSNGSVDLQTIEDVGAHKASMLERIQDGVGLASLFSDETAGMVSKNKELQGAIVELSFLKLMVLGQRGQSVGVKEFEKVLSSLAGNSSDPRVIRERMVSLMSDLEVSVGDQYAGVSNVYKGEVEKHHPQGDLTEFLQGVMKDNGMTPAPTGGEEVIDKATQAEIDLSVFQEQMGEGWDSMENIGEIINDPEVTLEELQVFLPHVKNRGQLALMKKRIADMGGK
jgi:hypothetical protein